MTARRLKLSMPRLALEQSVKRLSAQFVSFKNVDRDRDRPEDTREPVTSDLSRPDAFLLTDLANVPLPHPKNDAIGLGPFRTLTTSPVMRLEAFADYYRGRPNIDFVEVQEFDDPRTSWAALMREQLDAVHEIAPSAHGFRAGRRADSNVRTFPFTRPYFISLFFNVKHPVLKSPTVRQALSYAIDRKAIIDLAMNGQGEVAEGPIWPSHWAYSTAQKTYSRKHRGCHAPSRRRRPPTEAGRDGSDAKPLRFRCLTLAKDARYEKIALRASEAVVRNRRGYGDRRPIRAGAGQADTVRAVRRRVAGAHERPLTRLDVLLLSLESHVRRLLPPLMANWTACEAQPWTPMCERPSATSSRISTTIRRRSLSCGLRSRGSSAQSSSSLLRKRDRTPRRNRT